MTDFPSIGLGYDRLYRVGKCKKCGMAMFSHEPVAKEMYNFCSTDKQILRDHPRTPGENIVRTICQRHTDKNGKQSCRMSEAARTDLAGEIDFAINVARDGFAGVRE